MNLGVETQKITVHIPTHLLETARKYTQKSITETVKVGLEKIAQEQAYKELLSLEGSHTFSLNLNELREDKE